MDRHNEKEHCPGNVVGITHQLVPAAEPVIWQLGAFRNAQKAAGRGKVSAIRLAVENEAGIKPAGRFAVEVFRLFNKRVFFKGPKAR